jgi:hypothetical protein
MNIRVDMNTPIKDGTEVLFRSPVDCSQVTGLKVYYPENGATVSKEFAFADAHGNNVGDIDHLFAENVAVKVILDVTNGMAFVQNADTNAYLEGRFAEIEAKLENPGGITDEEFAAKVEDIVVTKIDDEGPIRAGVYDVAEESSVAKLQQYELIREDENSQGDYHLNVVTKEQHGKEIQNLYDYVDQEREHATNNAVDDVLSVVYTKPEVDAKVAEGKAVIVTVSGSTPSHTSQQIYDAILEGRAVYLKMWSGTYMALSWATADEANFEASAITTITGADGKNYGVQNFRLYRIVGNTYQANSGKMVSQEYVDAQIQYGLGQ